MTSIRELIPPPVRRPFGKLRAVYRRLANWRKVHVGIRGASEADSQVVTRALRRVPLTVWKDLGTWQFPMLDKDCHVQSKDVGQFIVRAFTDDLFHVLPGQEPAVEAAVRGHLRAGDTFVDAGANIGFYTILASRIVGPKGCVISCEMMPETARTLRRHVEMNPFGNVSVVEAALAESAGDKVVASYPSGKFGQASITRLGQGPQVSVVTATLADILRDVPTVRLMKMDLEGAELGALRGLVDDIGKIEAIVFESRNDPLTVAYLEESGFFVTRIDGNNALASRARGSV